MSNLEIRREQTTTETLIPQRDSSCFHMGTLLRKIIRRHKIESIDTLFSQNPWVEVKNYQKFVTNLTHLVISLDQLYHKINMTKKIEAVFAPTTPLLLYFKICEFELSENFLWDVEEISKLTKLCLDEIFDNIEEENELTVVLKNYYFSNGEHTFSNIGLEFRTPADHKNLTF